MMTATVEAESLTNMAGQTNTIFTADQQLYKVLSRHKVGLRISI